MDTSSCSWGTYRTRHWRAALPSSPIQRRSWLGPPLHRLGFGEFLVRVVTHRTNQEVLLQAPERLPEEWDPNGDPHREFTDRVLVGVVAPWAFHLDALESFE